MMIFSWFSLNYQRIYHKWVNCLYWTNQKNFLRGILLLAEVSEGINPKKLRILRMIPPILSIIYGESRGSEGHSLFCFGRCSEVIHVVCSSIWFFGSMNRWHTIPLFHGNKNPTLDYRSLYIYIYPINYPPVILNSYMENASTIIQ